MKRRLAATLTLFLLLATLVLALTGCNVTGEIKVTFLVDGAVYHTLTTTGGETLTLPTAPEKDGYTFGGWYLDEDYSRLFTADTLTESVPTADITVYAKWQSNETPPPTPPSEPGHTHSYV